MPNYDYECVSCGHALEQFQGIKESPLSTCPKCQNETLRRGIGGGGALFRFKGKGFYLTDYCSSGGEEKISSPPKGCGCSGGHTCK
jgi:putative FmdB family regulatory protein